MKSDGEKWVQNRKIMTPAFHFDILKKFFVVMNEKTNILLELLDKQANNGTSIDMKTYLKSFSLDVITGKKKLCALGHLNLKTL
jgi:cytochrome P450 family 4